MKIVGHGFPNDLQNYKTTYSPAIALGCLSERLKVSFHSIRRFYASFLPSCDTYEPQLCPPWQDIPQGTIVAFLIWR